MKVNVFMLIAATISVVTAVALPKRQQSDTVYAICCLDCQLSIDCQVTFTGKFHCVLEIIP